MMNKNGKMPVISDIAKASGVSVATVSQVLGNGTRPVSASTRERVMEVAARLSYHPNGMARSLARRRTNTIGLVFLHAHRPVHTSASFVLMLNGVLDEVTRLRLDTLLFTSYSWSDGRNHLSSLMDRRCDGLILIVPRLESEAVTALQQGGIPFVLLAGQSDDPNITTVDTDNCLSACDLVNHLMDLGHQRIALLYAPDEVKYSYARDRIAGYQRAFAERRLEWNPDFRVVVDSMESLERQILALMQRPAHERPTAICGIDDGMAMRAMNILQYAGWRVPEDVSVVGYDDIPDAATCRPGLTTMHQPLKQIGERCVEVLLSQIAGKTSSGQKIFYPTELVVRGSLAPPSQIIDRAETQSHSITSLIGEGSPL